MADGNKPLGPGPCLIPVYGGLDLDNIHIPRDGLYNPLLMYDFGVNIESAGEPSYYMGCRFIKGPASSFGGPRDKTIARKEVAALTGEVLRQLNNPDNPSQDDLTANPEKYYYAAMRIRYSSKTLDQWQTVRIIVVNPKTGTTLGVRVVDWGPGPSAGHRIVDLSPQSLRDLGMQTDQEPLVAFGTPDTPLGIIYGQIPLAP
jgi:hypothetical protein